MKKISDNGQLTMDNSEIPKDWEIKKLGEVCDLKSGKTIPYSIEKSKGEILYTKIGDMNIEGNENCITLSSRYVDKKDIKENQIIPVGSIIFPKRGGAIATNKKRRIIKPTIVDLNTMALVPSKLINKDYLFFWFQQIDLAKLSNGANIPQINNYSFDNVFISFPKSLPEQKRIVSILDRAFEAIDKAKANAEQNLKNAKELFESYLQGVFENKGDDWEEKKFGELFKLKSGDGLTAKKMIDGQYPVFGGNGIAGYHCKYNYEDQIIIGRVGALCGNVRLVNKKFWLTDNAFRISQGLEYFINNFVVYMLNHKNLRNYARQAAQPVISNSSLKNVIINYPKSIEEQKQIVQKLDSLSSETKKLESIYQQKINDLEELKKSILQKAFAGELI